MDTLKGVQGKATKMLKGLQDHSCEERLRDLGLLSLEQRPYPCLQAPKGKVPRGQSQALASGAHGQDQRPWAHTKRQEASSEHQEMLFRCESDQAPAQVAHRGCGFHH